MILFSKRESTEARDPFNINSTTQDASLSLDAVCWFSLSPSVLKYSPILISGSQRGSHKAVLSKIRRDELLEAGLKWIARPFDHSPMSDT